MSLLKKCMQTAIVNNLNVQQIRLYARWNHRRPLRVHLPEEQDSANERAEINTESTPNHVEEANSTVLKHVYKEPIKHMKITQHFPDNEQLKSIKTTQRLSGSEIKYVDDNEEEHSMKKMNLRKPQQKKKKLGTTDMLETVIDECGNVIYSKMANKDSRITKLFCEAKSKKKKEIMLLEGKRLIIDALTAGCKLEYLLFSRKQELEFLKPFLPKTGSKIYKMPYKEMTMWSNLTTSPGIIGVFKIPVANNFSPSNPLPLTIICDNVREPGNLGAILRTSAAAGCEKLILTKGCTFLWDTKVLRSAMGMHFKLNIDTDKTWDEIKTNINQFSNIFIADNKVVTETVSPQAPSESNVLELVQSIPLLPYYSIDYKSCRNSLLIVGGETEGISEESYRLASEFKGVRVNIPVNNNVESLNTGTALGIITFEIKRQLQVAQNCDDVVQHRAA